MTIVADTNIFLAVALDEPEKAAIVNATTDASIAAPEILPYEIGNALSAMVKRWQIDAGQAEAVRAVTQRIPVRLLAVDVAEALRVALQFDIYAYDAYFLTVARALACPLVTLDRQMQRVAIDMGLEVVEVKR